MRTSQRLDAILNDSTARLGNQTALLSCRRVTRSFGALNAVNKLSFDVEPGTIFGIGGPNGAGKTTLFDLICGLTPLSSGDVLFKGKQISGLQPFEVCHAGVARTFQLNAAFETMTVLENVLVAAQHGPRRASMPRLMFSRAERQHAQNALEMTGLSDRATATVSGLPLVEQKLLMIAAAIATQPSLLLLDEPVGGLIPSEIDRVERVIRKLTQQHAMTVMLIEHVMRFLVGLSDEVMIMHHGEMLYRGAPGGLASDKQVVETYLGEGASARLRSSNKSGQPKPPTAGESPVAATTEELADPWLRKVADAGRKLLKQYQSGRLYPIDYLQLGRILAERPEDDRPTALTRISRELLQAKQDDQPFGQKFEALARVFSEIATARRITSMQDVGNSEAERASAIESAARSLLEETGLSPHNLARLKAALVAARAPDAERVRRIHGDETR